MLCPKASMNAQCITNPRACAQQLSMTLARATSCTPQQGVGKACRGQPLLCSTYGTAAAAKELLNSEPTYVAVAARNVSFKWSFGGDDNRVATTLSADSFASPEVLLRDLTTACDSKALLPPAQLTQLHESSLPLLSQMCLAQLGMLLSRVAQLSGTESTTSKSIADTSSSSSSNSNSTTDHSNTDSTGSSYAETTYEAWVTALLSSVQSQINPVSTPGVQGSSHSSSSSSGSRSKPTASAITKLVWGFSETRIDPGGPLLAQLWAILEPQLQDLYSPDFATLTCALGIIVVDTGRPLQPPTLSSSPPTSSTSPSATSSETSTSSLSTPEQQQQQQQSSWVEVLGREAEYQLKQFPNDFDAFSLARLVSGLAGIGFDADGGFRTILMRAVYPSMKTIEEKAAVDFALAKFGKRSMKYDPRWTFAEMHWLPGHERDKRRIMKENWVKTQWGGY